MNRTSVALTPMALYAGHTDNPAMTQDNRLVGLDRLDDCRVIEVRTDSIGVLPSKVKTFPVEIRNGAVY